MPLAAELVNRPNRLFERGAMMIKHLIRRTLSIAALMFAAPAEAAIIDFENLMPGLIGSGYSEDGFTFTGQPGSKFRALNTSGSMALQGPNPFIPPFPAMFTLTRDSGLAFDFESLVVFAADSHGLGVPITFTGVTTLGATVFFTANTPEYGNITPIPATRTFIDLPDSFRSLVSVSWQDGAEWHQFDDVIVSVAAVPGVPEPGAWAMLVAGFGLIGSLLRARRSPGRILGA